MESLGECNFVCRFEIELGSHGDTASLNSAPVLVCIVLGVDCGWACDVMRVWSNACLQTWTPVKTPLLHTIPVAS